MARKKKREPSPTESLQHAWAKYGTWVTTGVAVVLAAVVVMTLVRRHREKQFATGRAELASIRRDDATAVMRLERLEREYGDTELGDRIQLKLAQALHRDGRYDEAEERFKKLLEKQDVVAIYRVQARLGWAYGALERKDYAEARKRFEQVEEEELYAFEARRMLELIDKLEKKETPKDDEKEAGKQ